MNELNVVGVAPVADIVNPIERLAILFDIHYDRLYRLARRLTASTDDALDLIQETFLKAAKHPQSIPVGFANEEAWLVRVLVNIRRDQWRKSSLRSRFEATSSEKTVFGSCEPGPRGRGHSQSWRLASTGRVVSPSPSSCRHARIRRIGNFQDRISA